MNINKRTIWLSIALLWAVWIVSFLFLHITRHPGHSMITLTGDGAKNYYTYLYEVLYGKGLWFTGMNYPYGEHLVYTDAQPLLSIPLVFLKNYLPVTRDTALTVMHLCLAGAYVLGIIYTFKTLLLFRLRPYAALLFATLIVLMTPQIFKLLGHFALAYTSFLPMLMYFSVRYRYGQARKYILYIFLLGIVMYFLHPYYVAMTLVWNAAYMLGALVLLKQPLKARWKHIMPLLIATVAILVFVQGFMTITDRYTDRPTHPHGTLVYVTTLQDVFTSDISPLWIRARDKGLISQLASTEEGYAYIGLAVTLILACSLIAGIIRLFRKKREQVSHGATNDEQAMGLWLFIGLMALILSMGIPFIWDMEWLLDYLSLFRQFRTLGRFSWIFHYTISIYAAVLLYRCHNKLLVRKHIVAAVSILVLPLLLWAYEVTPHIKMVRHLSYNAGNLYDEYFKTKEENWQQFLAAHQHKAEDFQALLLIPFIHVGSEKLAVGAGSGWLMFIGFKASVTTRLPIVDVTMSRSSWQQTGGQVRIAGGPFADKPLLRDMRSNKPFLLLQFEVDSISNDERYLLQASDYIGHFSQCFIYACYPERIRRLDRQLRDSVAAIATHQQQQDTCIGCGDIWYVNHCDEYPQQQKFMGNGALPAITGTEGLVLDIAVPTRKDSVLYEWSAWTLLSTKDFRTTYFTLSLLDSAGHVLYTKDALAKSSVDNLQPWYRTSVFFRVPPACTRIQCRIFNEKPALYLALDEMMLRPADALFITRSADGRIMANNHLLPLRR